MGTDFNYTRSCLKLKIHTRTVNNTLHITNVSVNNVTVNESN